MPKKLHRIYKDKLVGLGMSFELVKATPNFDLEHFRIRLGSDERGRERWLLFHTVEEPSLVPTDEQLRDVYIQMLVELPFKTVPGAQGETARLVAFINKSMNLVQFGYSEVDGRIYMRLYQNAGDGHLSSMALQSYIGTFQLLLDSFSRTIEAVAMGESSLPDVIKAILSPVDMNRS